MGEKTLHPPTAADTLRRVLSILLNLCIPLAEPIALPMSWDWGHESIFLFYTEDSNLFAAAVCTLVAAGQVLCLFTGRELPRWLKRLKFVAASCLALTMLTVVFVLAPMYGPDGYYVTLFTSSMFFHHFLNPVLAMVSFVLLERSPRLAGRDVWLALVPTVFYGSWLLGLNLMGLVEGPYPFLMIYHQSVGTTVAWCILILLMNLFYAWLLWLLGGNRRKRPAFPQNMRPGTST